MTKFNPNTLVPAIVFLVTFVAQVIKKPVSSDDATQLAILISSLIGVVWGMFTNHKVETKPPEQEPQIPSAP